MCLGAHPDDCDSSAGGLAIAYVEAGNEVLFVSVTSGNAGHHEMTARDLAARRKQEALRAAQGAGLQYIVLDHDDGRLMPSVHVREEILGLIREFRPDLLLGPRPFDYHPDHRAVGQLLIDVSYLLTVPLVRPDVPIMQQPPVMCHKYDGFQKPIPFQPDVAVRIDAQFERKVQMLACHESQVFEWLPFNQGCLETVPAEPEARLEWVRDWCSNRAGHVADACREALIARYGQEEGQATRYAEAFEFCEYGRRPSPELVAQLFPL
jgi:LmbE family N-acetylglucosaminyl deacetylase